MEPYYAAIRSAAAQIATHHEKQTFLKVIYENFYKVYNPKAADRLGVIYTPNEIVRFMIESADYLCEKHFGRNLIDRDVEILDPAAGELMDLHIGYESVPAAKLKRVDVPDEKSHKAGLSPKCVLKADKDGGRIIVDSETALTEIPPEAWDYRLGNRSALEWILDQYKEKKPKDPAIREKFNTYRFADYKEKVIDLLMRVTTVSVRTVAIVSSMKNLSR